MNYKLIILIMIFIATAAILVKYGEQVEKPNASESVSIIVPVSADVEMSNSIDAYPPPPEVTVLPYPGPIEPTREPTPTFTYVPSPTHILPPPYIYTTEKP